MTRMKFKKKKAINYEYIATKELRKCRERLGISIRQLADAIGMSHTYLSRFERGLVSLDEEKVKLIEKHLK